MRLKMRYGNNKSDKKIPLFFNVLCWPQCAMSFKGNMKKWNKSHVAPFDGVVC